jgi:hypothetical protein
VRVGFDKLDPRILPEMSVKVAFRETAAEGAAPARFVLVPKAAVQRHDGRDVVMVVRNGRSERRAVTVGAVDANDASVEAGLSAGERVVADWPPGLDDGISVKEIQP